MTDQSNKQAKPGGDAQLREANPDAPSARRRALVRGAAAAVPTILTLHSGAALARSSNLIGTVNTLTADDPANCLDTRGLTENPTGVYDLGDPLSAEVNVIPNREYSREPNNSVAARVTRQDMCTNGGTYYYNDNGWKQVNLPNGGGLVSAVALSSFAGRPGLLVRDL